MLVEPKQEARPFEVIKFSVGYARRVLVISPLVGVNTHFMRQTRICAGEKCPACLVGIAGKYHGYVVVLLDAQRRLLRLTQGVAFLGEQSGQFTPGRIVEVLKKRERRPLEVVTLGDSKTLDPTAIVSRLELLSVVSRLHGLPAVPDGANFEQALEAVACSAVTNIRLAMQGDLS